MGQSEFWGEFCYPQTMLTVGSISRDQAAKAFDFLALPFRGRRSAIRQLTHSAPEFVFWIDPSGRLHDAKDSHRNNPPRGFEHIIDDEPDYGGFLRGRVVRYLENQLIVVYCRPEALAGSTPSLHQFLIGIDQIPIPIDEGALVISDNADIYGTMNDLWERDKPFQPELF